MTPLPILRPVKVPVGHSSMQWNLSRAQQVADVGRIFDRMVARGEWWHTGTEAGEQPLRGILERAAQRHGYTFHAWRGNWVALRREVLVPGSYFEGDLKVSDASETKEPGHDAGLVWAGGVFKHGVGRATIAGSHFATKGDPSRQKWNLDVNRRLGRAVDDFGDRFGKGTSLAFVGLDSNIIDRKSDVFLGQAKFRSMWDEVGRWEKTHAVGNIDVIATWNADGRVKALRMNALTDREFFLHGDHYYVEGLLEVRPLRTVVGQS